MPEGLHFGTMKADFSNEFDPFSDRTSRDVRNSLSNALAEAIEKNAPETYRSRVRNCLEILPPGEIADYAKDRLRRYERAFSAIGEVEEFGLFAPAIVLWNHGLFFEFHECIEKIWQDSSGTLRNALKGMIQAAGFYIHLERGRKETAVRLGSKAARLISENRDGIRFVANLDALIDRLSAGDSEPVALDAGFSTGEF